MKRMLAAVAAAFLAVGVASAAEPPKGKVTIAQKDAAAAKKGPVTFDHASATHKAQKCETCHGKAEGGKMELDMKSGHATCQKCHNETAKADAAKKAIASCDNCHAKK